MKKYELKSMLGKSIKNFKKQNEIKNQNQNSKFQCILTTENGSRKTGSKIIR